MKNEKSLKDCTLNFSALRSSKQYSRDTQIGYTIYRQDEKGTGFISI